MSQVRVEYNIEREKWMVTENGNAVSLHNLKQTAEKEGRRHAKSIRPSKLVIETKVGKTSLTQEYD